MTYYLAYGSNLNKAQMSQRCPKAKAIGPVRIPNTRLIFRGVADVEHCKGRYVEAGLWKITKDCEAELDRYEGVKSKLYRKEYLPIRVNKHGIDVTTEALIYVMNRDEYAHPSEWYLGCIGIGFDDFGLDRKALGLALRDTAKEVGMTFSEYWDDRDFADEAAYRKALRK